MGIKMDFCIAAVPACFFLFLLSMETKDGRFSAGTQAAIFAPQSGEEVLFIRVREILQLIRQTGLKNYRLSPVLGAKGFLCRQITASAWLMAKPDAASRYLFIDNSEIGEYRHLVVLKESRNVSLLIAD